MLSLRRNLAKFLVPGTAPKTLLGPQKILGPQLPRGRDTFGFGWTALQNRGRMLLRHMAFNYLNSDVSSLVSGTDGSKIREACSTAIAWWTPDFAPGCKKQFEIQTSQTPTYLVVGPALSNSKLLSNLWNLKKNIFKFPTGLLGELPGINFSYQHFPNKLQTFQITTKNDKPKTRNSKFIKYFCPITNEENIKQKIISKHSQNILVQKISNLHEKIPNNSNFSKSNRPRSGVCFVSQTQQRLGVH